MDTKQKDALTDVISALDQATNEQETTGEIEPGQVLTAQNEIVTLGINPDSDINQK